MPQELTLPNNPDYYTLGIDDNLIKQFLLLRRWLGFPTEIHNFNNDESQTSKWTQDEIVDLPKDRKYQHCLLKLNKKQEAQLLGLHEFKHFPEED